MRERNEEIKILKRHGWRFVRYARGIHQLWACPHGCCRTIASNGGDRHARQNLTADIRRCPGARAEQAA